MATKARAGRCVIVLIEALLAAAALIVLAESFGWHVLSEAGGAPATASAAQQTYRVPLEVTPGSIQGMYLSVDIQTGQDGRLRARLPGGGEAQVERMAAPVQGLIVRVTGGEPATLALLPDQQAKVTMKRTLGHQDRASYLIGYNRWERDGKVHESLSWCPVYRAEGRLKIAGCDMNIAVIDLNGDAVFDRKDSLQGTTIALDVDNDGRFWGSAEWRKANEIIEVCGRPVEIADLDPAGLSITFKDSHLTRAATGTVVPSFAVTSSKGQTIRSDDFRGRVHLLDFWASWCGPCVASLAHVEAIARQHGNAMAVIGINVDEPAQRDAAEKVVADRALSFPQVIRGLGEDDYLWKMFGSMESARLSVPLYVVIDTNGVIRYAGSGGEDLAEVRKILEELVK